MKPFLQGRKPNSAKPLAASLPTTNGAASPHRGHASHGGTGGAHAGAGAQVEVVKQGDKVVRIIVTCACGERTEVECIYPAGS